MWSDLRYRLRALCRPNVVETELDDELRFHLGRQIEKHVQSGMSHADARRRAHLELGGIEQVREECRAARGISLVETLAQDVRYGLRQMRRSPAFAAAAILTLAVGIGINTAVFTVTDAVLFKGFPLVRQNDRVVYIASQTNGQRGGLSYPDFQSWRAQLRSVRDLAACVPVPVSLGDENRVEGLYSASEVTANAFRVLGRPPFIGRDFQPSDDLPGAAPVAILSYAFWRSRFGGNRAIVGQAVRMNGALTTIIGVMPEGFSFPEMADLWLPLVPTAALQRRDVRHLWFAFGRMKDGVTIAGVRAEMDAIGGRLAATFPRMNHGVQPTVDTFTDFFIGSRASAIYGTMWAAVTLVLLIACANLANLTLARSLGRTREFSVRIALGAGRGRVIRQLLTECLLLSVIGGVAGCWLADVGIGALVLGDMPWLRPFDLSMDYRVLAYLAVISVATAMLFALGSIVRLSRLDLNAALKDGGRGMSLNSAGRGRPGSMLLMTAEMALAVVLLCGASAMIRSVIRVASADLGFHRSPILAALVNLPDQSYHEGTEQISFYQRLEAELGAIPSIEAATIASVLPSGIGPRVPYETSAGKSNSSDRPTVTTIAISPHYFRTLGVAVTSGRDFTELDSASTMPVVIVNQRFAALRWPHESPLGKELRLFEGTTPGPWRIVVGVAANVIQNGIGERFDPTFRPVIYLPYRQEPQRAMWVLTRAPRSPGLLIVPFRRAVAAVDPGPIVWRGPDTLADFLRDGQSFSRSMAAVFVLFAAIALLLASLGLYAVVAHTIGQRTREIGIRMALGSTAADIRRLVFRQGMLPVLAGLVIGLSLAFVLMPLLKSAFRQVSPADPATFFVATGVLLVAAGLGCSIPAHRATRVDPVVVLRQE